MIGNAPNSYRSMANRRNVSHPPSSASFKIGHSQRLKETVFVWPDYGVIELVYLKNLIFQPGKFSNRIPLSISMYNTHA